MTVDLTNLPEREHSLLECEAVYAKAHQGVVRFDGSVLVFEEYGAAGGGQVLFPITGIKGMQVSKTGSSKILLKILTDSNEGDDALFDFTNTINGLAWREAFKDSLTSKIRSLADSSPPAASAPESVSAASRPPAEKSPSRAPKVTGANTLKLSAADIKSFLEAHPALLDLYAEQVGEFMLIASQSVAYHADQ